MADVGFKISQPFKDANSASDDELLFSSSWPSLPIAFETTVFIPHFTFNYEVRHGLGFPPLTIAWRLLNGSSQLLARTDPPDITKTFALLNNFDNDEQDAYYHIKCYNIDISKQKDYPIVKSSGAGNSPYDPDYGIKLVKAGKDPNSDDLRDFIIHSRGQSPLIQSIVTEESVAQYVTSTGSTINNAVKYTNPKGQVNWVYAYAGVTDPDSQYNGEDTYIFAPVGSQAYPGLFIDNDTFLVTTAPGFADKASLIVLRDPLFASNDLEVTY